MPGTDDTTGTTGTAVTSGPPAPVPVAKAPPAWLAEYKGEPIPEKFHRNTLAETLNEVVKSYGESEKQLSRKAEKKPDEKQGPEEKSTTPRLHIGALETGDDELAGLTARDVIGLAGLNEEDVLKEWDENDGLKPETYAALRKVNPALGRSLVNELVSGIRAKAALRGLIVSKAEEECERMAGGADKLSALLKEANTFLGPGEIEGFNRMLKDPVTAPSAVRALLAMRDGQKSADGSRPLITGTTGQSGPAGGAKDAKEFQAAMRRIQMGDRDAWDIIKRTPQELIDSWNRGG